MKNNEIITANELYNQTSNWVDKFNFIHVDVLNKMCDNMLYEYIRQEEIDYDEFLNDYSLNDEYQEYLKEEELEDNDENKEEWCQDQHQFCRFEDERSDQNYPMWNTCFEFKDEPGEEIIQAAIDAGFGVIEGMDDFNTTLFVAGCGYSFYGAHWIPLFLNLPWNENLKKQVEELKIDYKCL